MVRVSVTNNGPRIPESEQSLLFRARLADEGGRRRGLLVVRFVAKRCGGDAEFRFSDERGTCFEFCIPLAGEARRDAA
jgi:signal transduction histidine kinase